MLFLVSFSPPVYLRVRVSGLYSLHLFTSKCESLVSFISPPVYLRV
jgi:hypothetical protein